KPLRCICASRMLLCVLSLRFLTTPMRIPGSFGGYRHFPAHVSSFRLPVAAMNTRTHLRNSRIVTAICYTPPTAARPRPAITRIVNCSTMEQMSEDGYFELLRAVYNDRNPHAPIGEEFRDLE